MVWVRIDDQVAHHPKFVEAGPVASWLWVCGNCYCNKYLTDGFIPSVAVPTLGDIKGVEKLVPKLLAARLWEECKGGYRVHDFLAFNPSAEEVRRKRAAARQSGKVGAKKRWGPRNES